MKIRLEGTETEIAAAAARIATVLDVQEASSFYPNRRPSTLGRVYLTVVTPDSPSGPVRAESERADRGRRLPGTSRKEIR